MLPKPQHPGARGSTQRPPGGNPLLPARPVGAGANPGTAWPVAGCGAAGVRVARTAVCR